MAVGDYVQGKLKAQIPIYQSRLSLCARGREISTGDLIGVRAQLLTFEGDDHSTFDCYIKGGSYASIEIPFTYEITPRIVEIAGNRIEFYADGILMFTSVAGYNLEPVYAEDDPPLDPGLNLRYSGFHTYWAISEAWFDDFSLSSSGEVLSDSFGDGIISDDWEFYPGMEGNWSEAGGKLIFVPGVIDIPCARYRGQPSAESLQHCFLPHGSHLALAVGEDVKLRRTLDYPSLPAYAEEVAIETGGRSPGLMRAGGSLLAVWIRRSDKAIRYAESTDDGKTWSAPMSIATGYLQVEGESLQSAGLALAMLLKESDLKWYQTMGTYSGGAWSWTTPALAVNLAAKKARGSLRFGPDGSAYFYFVDSVNAVRLYRCAQVKQDGSGAWAEVV